MILLRPTTSKKNRGDSWHPYLSPLLSLNNFEAGPFIKVAKENDFKEPST